MIHHNETYKCNSCDWEGDYYELTKFGDNIYCPECRMIDPECIESPDLIDDFIENFYKPMLTEPDWESMLIVKK